MWELRRRSMGNLLIQEISLLDNELWVSSFVQRLGPEKNETTQPQLSCHVGRSKGVDNQDFDSLRKPL